MEDRIKAAMGVFNEIASHELGYKVPRGRPKGSKNGPKRFACSCGNQFVSPDGFRRHWKMMVQGDRNELGKHHLMRLP